MSRPQRIHIVGVGGSGMSAIAIVLAGMGHQVSGSDLTDSELLRQLAGRGVATSAGHDAAAVIGADLVCVSTAIPLANPEVVEAASRGVPVLRRAEILAAICARRRTLAVAGTHGKTTTSSMLALVLSESGFRPSFVIGGDIEGFGPGAAWRPDGDWMVVEADESDGTFLSLGPFGALVTSVEADHLDYYGDFAHVARAFEQFVSTAPGPRVVCVDDPGGAALASVAGGSVITYGVGEGARYRMTGLCSGRRTARFELSEDGAEVGEVIVKVPGAHNARNACGALAMARALGVPWSQALSGLDRYVGVARRFEWRGWRDGVTFIDDYGHLPGEVRPVLAAARAGGWRRVVAVFQPHRYSRTEALWAEFADAFLDADLLFVTDVYPAGEAPRPGVSGRLIADAVRAAHPESDVRYCPGRLELLAALESVLRPGDLCLTLAAGDLTTLPDQLLSAATWKTPAPPARPPSTQPSRSWRRSGSGPDGSRP